MDIQGKQLKQFRNQLVLSLEQVEEETRVRANIITNIENDNTDSIASIYLNAYKKTLWDFYDKASNNTSYLASIKNIPIASYQIQERHNKKNEKIYHTIEKKSEIKNNKPIFNVSNGSSFTSVPINPEDIKKTILNQNETINDNKTKTNIKPENIIEIKEEKTKNTLKKKYKLQSSINLNKRILKKTLNINIKDLLIYIAGGIIIMTIIFFVFIYDSLFSNSGSENTTQYNTDINGDSILSITSNENNIYTYFEKDSVILTASCNDTAWVKVELDNKKTDQLTMTPGMKNIWTASETITLTTSNVGAINFYKNDTLLPMLGAKGTMVQNIVITKDGIKNVNPLSTDNNPVPINELHPNQNAVVPSTTDTIKPQSTSAKQVTIKKKKEEPPKQIIMNFSKPTNTKPPILENEKKEKND